MMRTYTLATIILLSACSPQQRSPSVYELPGGYMGWTCVDFNRSACPETPYVDGKWIFKFSSTGYICTSSNIEYGRAKDEWYFVNNNERMPVSGDMIQHGGVSNVGSLPGEPETTVLSLFFGKNGTHNNYESCEQKVQKYWKSKQHNKSLMERDAQNRVR